MISCTFMYTQLQNVCMYVQCTVHCMPHNTDVEPDFSIGVADPEVIYNYIINIVINIAVT